MTLLPVEGQLFGRRRLVDVLARSLADERAVGAVIVGEAGSGKTALAKEALKAFQEQACIIHIHGSAVAARMPYGALRSLLVNVDEAELKSPLAVLQRITSVLQERAHGKPVILFVDNAQGLDEQGATAIDQLAANGTVRLLLVCEDLPAVPGSLMRLWTDGLVRRFDVAPLDLEQTAELMSGWLGATVSRSAAEILCEASGGNVLFLLLLTREQVDTGVLVLRDGVWVFAGAAASVHGEIVDVLSARLARLSSAEREVLELLTLTDGMGLTDLLNLVQSRHVDTLQENGTIWIDQQQSPMVQIRSKLVAEVIRGSTPISRSRILHRKVLATIEPAAMNPLNFLAYACWTLDCGSVLAPEAVIRAARTANHAQDPATALRLLSVITGGECVAAAILEEARARINQGDIAEAEAILRRYEDRQDFAPTLSEWVQHQLLRSYLKRGIVDDWPEVRRLLAGVRARLYPEPLPAVGPIRPERSRTDVLSAGHSLDGRAGADGESGGVAAHGLALADVKQGIRVTADPLKADLGEFKTADFKAKALKAADLAAADFKAADFKAAELEAGELLNHDPIPARLRQELTLAEMDFAVFTGRYDEIEPALHKHLEDGGYGSDIRMHLSSWLAETWAMTGRQADAVELAEHISKQLRMDAFHPSTRAVAGSCTYVAFLVAGAWDRCTDMLGERSALGWAGGPDAGSSGELAEGVLHAFGGRAQQSLDKLLPAISQLKIRNSGGALVLALSAAAYAYSLLDEPDQVRHFRRELRKCRQQPSWQVGECAFYFSTLAELVLEQRPEVIDRLLERADTNARKGTTTQELLLVSAAARLGDEEAARRLITVAAAAQGPFAQLCVAYGKGLVNRDSSELIVATRMAATIGNDLFAMEAAHAALETARSASIRSLMRRAQQLIHGSHRKIWGTSLGGILTRKLTDREREIATIAATGASNRRIADELHLSVRTVEGHLQQIYKKLQVSERSDLTSV